MNATGTFTAKKRGDNVPQVVPTIGRMLLEKVWSGDLAGSSTVEMLSFMTPVAGSAVYVAIEVVQATLNSQRGSFAFCHLGLSERGQQSLTYRVISDSGTDELTGLNGELQLNIVDGVHQYILEFTL